MKPGLALVVHPDKTFADNELANPLVSGGFRTEVVTTIEEALSRIIDAKHDKIQVVLTYHRLLIHPQDGHSFDSRCLIKQAVANCIHAIGILSAPDEKERMDVNESGARAVLAMPFDSDTKKVLAIPSSNPKYQTLIEALEAAGIELR